jgi:predicted permease
MLPEAVRRLRGAFGRRHVERRLDSEMQFHLDMLTEKHVRHGLDPADARRVALAEFGGAERFKDDVRDEYRSRLADELAQDIRYSARVLRRHPGFTVAAALTFALGIGASAAMFSVVNGVLLEPLPYAEPDRLVVLWEKDVARGKDRNVVSVPNFEAWRDRARSVSGTAAAVPLPATITGSAGPERVIGAEVSAGYFGLLGVRPALGREFTRDDELSGGANVVVLSDQFWRTRYGADSAAVGRALVIEGRPHTIIGVMPPTFDPPRFAWLTDQAFWRPFGPTENNRGWGRFLLVVARLRDGVPIDRARREMETIARDRATEDKRNEGWSATVVPMAEQLTGDVRLPLLVLLGAVGLLLLMAVTNVANLTLGLVRHQSRELSVRRAIGATSSRVLRQLLTQSACVAGLGSAAGLAAAWLGVAALKGLLPPEMPRTSNIGVNGTVLGVGLVVSVVAAFAVGAIAAMRGGRGDATTLRDGDGRVSGRLRGGALVTTEIALGLVLTVLAGLTMRSFAALRAVDLGFASDQVVMARIGLSGPRYATPEAKARFFSELATRVATTAGVEAASIISVRPFGGMAPATSLGDANSATSGDSVVADVRFIDGGFFRTLRIPMLAGEAFGVRDAIDAPPRVIIGDALAKTMWPGTSAIGKRLRIPMFGGITPEVIGVVGDVRLMDARTAPRAAVYLADSRFPAETRDLVVRASGTPESIAAAVRATVASMDPMAPVYQVTTMSGLVNESLARDRFTLVLLGSFAVVSLLLAAVGIYGVFAADVAQRRKEIGIRVALGAPTGGVVALVLRGVVVRAAVGVALGIVLGLGAARAMRSLLYGVGSADPVSFIGVAALLMLVAVVATLVPALRASRVSPLTALRID